MGKWAVFPCTAKVETTNVVRVALVLLAAHFGIHAFIRTICSLLLLVLTPLVETSSTALTLTLDSIEK